MPKSWTCDSLYKGDDASLGFAERSGRNHRLDEIEQYIEKERDEYNKPISGGSETDAC